MASMSLERKFPFPQSQRLTDSSSEINQSETDSGGSLRGDFCLYRRQAHYVQPVPHLQTLQFLNNSLPVPTSPDGGRRPKGSAR